MLRGLRLLSARLRGRFAVSAWVSGAAGLLLAGVLLVALGLFAQGALAYGFFA